MGIDKKYALLDKKTYVLNQMMEIMHSNRVYVFCSDDFKARQSIASLVTRVHCISILGVFYKLMKMGKKKSEMYDEKFQMLRNGDLKYIK